MLEVLVHQKIDPVEIPTFQYLAVSIPNGVELETVDLSELPGDWSTQPAVTQEMGNRWLLEMRNPLLQVPSVLAPETWNILVNPQHTACQGLKIDRTYQWPLDKRLAGCHS
jgi:RES domain-containing protein